MSTAGQGPRAGVSTLIFDVLGTVVDEAGSIAAETARALAAAGVGPGGVSPALASSQALADYQPLLDDLPV